MQSQQSLPCPTGAPWDHRRTGRLSALYMFLEELESVLHNRQHGYCAAYWRGCVAGLCTASDVSSGEAPHSRLSRHRRPGAPGLCRPGDRSTFPRRLPPPRPVRAPATLVRPSEGWRLWACPRARRVIGVPSPARRRQRPCRQAPGCCVPRSQGLPPEGRAVSWRQDRHYRNTIDLVHQVFVDPATLSTYPVHRAYCNSANLSSVEKLTTIDMAQTIEDALAGDQEALDSALNSAPVLDTSIASMIRRYPPAPDEDAQVDELKLHTPDCLRVARQYEYGAEEGGSRHMLTPKASTWQRVQGRTSLPP